MKKKNKTTNKKIPYPFFNTGCPLRASRVIRESRNTHWRKMSSSTESQETQKEQSHIGPLQLVVKWYKIRHVGEQALGHPKQRKCKFVLMKLLCSGSPSGQLALQHAAKGPFCRFISRCVT